MIQIKNLHFGYSKQFNLFNDLNLSVSEGSVIGLLGKNGAGKSTLLKIVAGLIPVNNGSISTLGTPAGERATDMLEDLYFVPEELYLPSITIEKYIKSYAPLYKNFNYEQLNSILIEFELPSNAKLDRVSYGQKKKFLIAFALSTGCKLLIFDEPTNGLDVPSKSTFRKVISSTIREDQIAIISTHQVRDIDSILDSVIMINNGRIALDSSTYDLSNRYNSKLVPTLEGTGQVYSEPAVGGFKILTEERDCESDLDLELLFTAIVRGDVKQ